jgi:hypothetical protein
LKQNRLVLVCTEIGTNRARYLYSALAHHRRESLFDTRLLTAVLAGHFKVQIMGTIWMQFNTDVMDSLGLFLGVALIYPVAVWPSFLMDAGISHQMLLLIGWKLNRSSGNQCMLFSHRPEDKQALSC